MKRKITKYLNNKQFSYGDTVYNISDITDFFIVQNNKIEETVNHFNLGSVSNFYNILKYYNIKKPGYKRSELVKKGCLEKYGVDCSSKSEKVKKDRQKRNIEKYGVDEPFKLESIRTKIK